MSLPAEDPERTVLSARSWARRRWWRWLTAGGVLGGLGAALLPALTAAPHASLTKFSQALGGDVQQLAQTLGERAAALAAQPRLAAVVATDAETARDLTDEELGLRPEPDEVIALAQTAPGGAPAVPLLTRPAHVPFKVPLGAAGLVALGDAAGVRLCQGVAAGQGGLLVVCRPLPLLRTRQALLVARAAATLTVGGATVPLRADAAAADAEPQSLTLHVDGMRLQLDVHLPPPPPSRAPWLLALSFWALALASWLVGRRRPRRRRTSPLPSPSRREQTPATHTHSRSGSGTRGSFPSIDVVGEVVADFAPATGGETPARAALQRLGRYSIVRRLGSGGMADVYLARCNGAAGFEREVAVKVITAKLAHDPDLLAQFLDEARLAGCVRHPNVVQIYDLDRQDDRYFIAMEYVEGADLSRLLKITRRAEREVPLAIAFRIAAQVCAGVHAAHSATASDGQPLELVHRDVKSANILVSRHGDVKVSDFGIARAREGYLLHRTQRGEMKGTPSYMAPEQILNNTIDARCDEYAVAAIVYELFSSRRINLDPERLWLLGRAGWPHLEPLAQRRPGVPEELDAIVQRGLAFSADDRYPDCAALLDAIEAVASRHGGMASERAVGAWVDQLTAWDEANPSLRMVG